MQFSFLSQLPFIHSGCDRGPGFAKDVVVAVNDDGDDVEGTIEWDSTSLKATRHLFFVVAAVDDVVAAVDDDDASLCRFKGYDEHRQGGNCGNLWQLCALATRVPKSCEYCVRPNIDAPNSSPRRLLVLEHPVYNAVSLLICSIVRMPEEEEELFLFKLEQGRF